MSNTSAFDMPNIGVRLEKNGALLICSVLPAHVYPGLEVYKPNGDIQVRLCQTNPHEHQSR